MLPSASGLLVSLTMHTGHAGQRCGAWGTPCFCIPSSHSVSLLLILLPSRRGIGAIPYRVSHNNGDYLLKIGGALSSPLIRFGDVGLLCFCACFLTLLHRPTNLVHPHPVSAYVSPFSTMWMPPGIGSCLDNGQRTDHRFGYLVKEKTMHCRALYCCLQSHSHRTMHCEAQQLRMTWPLRWFIHEVGQ